MHYSVLEKSRTEQSKNKKAGYFPSLKHLTPEFG